VLNIQQVLLRDRFRAYKGLFTGDNGKVSRDGERVLADLKKFCRGDRSTHIPNDPYSSANLEGRREVWLRICSFLNLSESDIYMLKEEIYDDGTGKSNTAISPDIGEFDN
jgi:hypothetical protein